MKKLMKKKVSLFGKSVSVFVIVAIGMAALVTATLVPYLSGLVTGDVTVDSPMQITLDSITGEDNSISGDTFTVALLGGESFALTTTTTNLGSEITEPVLIEVKVPNFDGVGITYAHNDGTWEGPIPVCVVEEGDDAGAYYYVGPDGGFTVPAGYTETATSTITTDLALEPREGEDAYVATVQVIKAANKVKNCIPLE